METLDAKAIRAQGRLIKTWEVSDGPWYTDKYQVWKIEDKFYQIKDHEGNSFSCTCCRYGEVTEIYPIPEPTHICVIMGQQEGKAYIAEQKSGTLEELMDWATRYIQENNMRPSGCFHPAIDQHLQAKFVPLQIDL